MDCAVVCSGLLIFLARVTDMSLATLRILMLVRGRSLLASTIGFLESIIYLLALSQVVQNMNSPLNIVLFAAGFAVGNYVGSRIEERIALGYVNVQVISVDRHESLQAQLRDEGFGVTSVECSGKDGLHNILYILAKRRDLPKLMTRVNQEDQKAFIFAVDTCKNLGGFFPIHKAK
ncbi:MAG: DUF2179 domain-containing protein [Dethiobacteria bacterium]|jgi:uncharacterized protein YebE (UPF0316 family)